MGGGDDRKKRKPVCCDRRDPDRRRMRFPLLCCPGSDGLGRATGPIIGDASGERARRHKSGFKKKTERLKNRFPVWRPARPVGTVDNQPGASGNVFV